jgi:hypothetical protein
MRMATVFGILDLHSSAYHPWPPRMKWKDFPHERPVADVAFAVFKMVARACLVLKCTQQYVVVGPIIDARQIPSLRSVNLHVAGTSSIDRH